MFKKILSAALCLTLIASTALGALSAQAVTVQEAQTSADCPAASASGTLTDPSDFSWDNASVYFLLTDRFFNGNTSNDHSYGRSLDRSGNVQYGNSDCAAFHGGDFAGITKKINDGYFENLGVNALWISAPYEQIHGYCMDGTGHTRSFPHYSYHGYYALDFSQTDANFGTEEEFEQMVDTAHEHGIRIVLDVVMNHVGYNTLADMSEYNYGTLKSGWEDSYYNCTLIDTSYHTYIDYNNGNEAWARWWGPDWIRAGLAGYTPAGNDDLTKSLTYLPDVKTESTKTVDIPQILKTKWTKENTLSSKQAELNNYFSSTGKSKTTRNYLVYWLSQWVEKYGVDGFRCDTAKHVELESWRALKEQCVSSLKTWRQNNPDKAGADWDEDFWMTGECFPHYLSKDSYYTSGGFDSMLNFSFNSGNSFNASGSGVPSAGSINDTYSSYASQLNNDDSYNVLTYISSHDTSLCRNNLMYQGSAFQLLPGAIQIYYGDESNRPLEGGLAEGKDHNLRSDMNWSSMDNAMLQHWQKVGQFRSNHVAVGAGSHTNLSATSGAAFARTYNKNGVSDKVAACIGASSNTNVTITLNNTFPDGTVLKNTYDNSTAAVSGGKVTFNSGANGTILLEVSGQDASNPDVTNPTGSTAATTPSETTAPSETVAPPETTAPTLMGIYGDVNGDNIVNISDATAIQKHIAAVKTLSGLNLTLADTDGNGRIAISDATYIQKFLAGMSDAANVNTQYIVAPATEPAATTVPATTAATEPPTTPPVADGTTVYFNNTDNWSKPCVYYWADGSEGPIAWPGADMTQTPDGYWTYTIPTGYNKCIFSDNGNNQTQTGNLDVPPSGSVYDYASGQWQTP